MRAISYRIQQDPATAYDRRVQLGLRHFFNILGLETFQTLGNGEFDTVTFLQGLVSVAYDRRIVHKDVPARSPLDESETFFVVEPLDLALLFTHHPQYSFSTSTTSSEV